MSNVKETVFTKLNKSDYYLRKDKRITNEQKNTQSAGCS